MKENDNPFQPVLAEPVDDSVLATDPQPDNFMGDAPMPSAKPPRPGASIDGISPAGSSVTFKPADAAPKGDSGHLDPLAGFDLGGENKSGTDNDTPDSNHSDETLSDNSSIDTALDSLSQETAAAAAPVDKKAAKLAEKEAKRAAKEAKKAEKAKPVEKPAPVEEEPVPVKEKSSAPVEEKPPKQLTISLLTIIFFVLTLAGAGGTFYFYSQNSKNSNELATVKADLAALRAQNTDNNISNDISSGNFDSLQTTVANQQKTIDDQKSQIDTLTKDKTDLTAQVTDLNTKVNGINTVTTQVNGLLTGQCFIAQGSSTNPCSAVITPASGDQPARLTITPRN
jgi:hypothetical protein